MQSIRQYKHSLSMLQHIRQIHPGSPFKTMTNVRLLEQSQYIFQIVQYVMYSHNT